MFSGLGRGDFARMGAKGKKGTGAVAFSGLIDVLAVSAIRAYSVRKLRSAYAGSAIRIRRSSDNAEQDIGFSGEDLDTAAITTFVGANSAFLTKIYDQSGSADNLVQATTANQPRLVNAGTLDTKNTKPAPTFNTSSYVMAGTTSFTAREAGLILSTTEAGATWSTFRGPFSSLVTGGALLGWSAHATYLDGQATSFQQTINVNNTGTSNSVFGGALQQLDVIDSAGSTWDGPQIGQQQNLGVARAWPGTICEVVVFSSALTAGNRTAMYSNQKAYWGTP